MDAIRKMKIELKNNLINNPHIVSRVSYLLYFVCALEFISIRLEMFDKILVSLLSVHLLLVYIYTGILLIIKYGILTIQSLLFISVGVFNYSRVFLTLIDYRFPFYSIRSLVNTDLSYSVQSKLIFIFLIFLTIYQHMVLSLDLRIGKKTLKDSVEFVTIGKYLMIGSLPFLIYRLIIEAAYVFNNGYVNIYLNGLQRSNYNLPVRLSFYVFSVGYYCLISGLPKFREFNIFSMIYFLTVLLDTLKGSRGPLILFVLFYLWSCKNIYNKEIKAKVLVLLGTMLIVLSQIIAIIRGDNNKVTSIIFMIMDFFYLQGQSIIVPSLYISYGSNIGYNKYPYILSPIMYLFEVIKDPKLLTLGQSIKLLETRFDLSHHLTHYLNSEYYLKGMSIGNNFLAELYEFGILGVIGGTILIVLFISFFNKNVLRNRVLLYLSFLFVTHYIYIPRTTFFINLYHLSRNIVAYTLIYALVLFLQLFKRKKKVDI